MSGSLLFVRERLDVPVATPTALRVPGIAGRLAFGPTQVLEDSLPRARTRRPGVVAVYGCPSAAAR